MASDECEAQVTPIHPENPKVTSSYVRKRKKHRYRTQTERQHSQIALVTLCLIRGPENKAEASCCYRVAPQQAERGGEGVLKSRDDSKDLFLSRPTSA